MSEANGRYRGVCFIAAVVLLSLLTVSEISIVSMCMDQSTNVLASQRSTSWIPFSRSHHICIYVSVCSCVCLPVCLHVCLCVFIFVSACVCLSPILLSSRRRAQKGPAGGPGQSVCSHSAAEDTTAGGGPHSQPHRHAVRSFSHDICRDRDSLSVCVPFSCYASR